MSDIDFLEHGGGHLHVRHRGELIPLADPRALHYQQILMTLIVGHIPGTPTDIPEWKRELVFERWCAAWDMPDPQNARRLAYLVDTYRSAIAYDLMVHASADLGELWRARRWRLLLDLLDHLPAHSWYSSTVSMDEEHARMMADAIIAQQEANPDRASDTRGPSLTTWTPEVAALTNILDAVRGVQHAVVAVNSPKGKAPDSPKPSPRPVTPLEAALKRADHHRRKAKHESLVSRLLPGRG